MTFKNTKTILFASLIVAMVLPFSGMNYATAEMSDVTEKRLVSTLKALDRMIESATDETTKQALIDRQQTLLENLYEDVKDMERPEAVKGESKTSTSAEIDLFNLAGVHKGCDNQNETWNFEVDYATGGTWLSVDQWFPTILTTGDSPNCEEHTWKDNVYLDIARWNDNQGCVSNLDVDPVDSYSLNCGVVLYGFYIVSVTADYDGEQTSSYTWFWVV